MAIRVLIVDDSALARSLIRSILENAGGFEVVGEAENGDVAVNMANQFSPNLITMDLEMPSMHGYEAIERIMQAKARPILVVSNVANAENAFKAVSMGAVDTVHKPSLDEDEQIAFVAKARLVASIPVITRVKFKGTRTDATVQNIEASASLIVATRTAPSAKPSSPPPMRSKPAIGVYPRAASATLSPVSPGQVADVVLAIASSTGGPQALAKLLQDLAARVRAGIVIAQHISQGFAPGMAGWLNSVTPLTVKVGEAGELVRSQVVYISPSEANMTITRSRRIALDAPAASAIYRPSCDHLLTSAATAYGKRCIGVILSGMGHDGVQGLKAIKQGGGLTLGQDEASSVIYGMNGQAHNAGVVDREYPLDRLADALVARLATFAPKGESTQ